MKVSEYKRRFDAGASEDDLLNILVSEVNAELKVCQPEDRNYIYSRYERKSIEIANRLGFNPDWYTSWVKRVTRKVNNRGNILNEIEGWE